jgi:hypothetical protein
LLAKNANLLNFSIQVLKRKIKEYGITCLPIKFRKKKKKSHMKTINFWEDSSKYQIEREFPHPPLSLPTAKKNQPLSSSLTIDNENVDNNKSWR